MVIFGAGASYDSYYNRPPPNANHIRLPLANDLFSERFGDEYRVFPQSQGVIPRLQEQGIDVEAVLENLQREANTRYEEGLAQLTAIRYYLQLMISECQRRWTEQLTKGVTNYTHLVDRLARERDRIGKTCLVTFNYDTLLDETLNARAIKFSSMSDYVSGNLPLIKLHGSINWVHPITNFSPDAQKPAQEYLSDIIDKTSDLVIDTKSFEIAAKNPLLRPRKPLFPAITIPVQNKKDFECPDEHLTRLTDSLPEVERLLIVGWKARERNFLGLLVKEIPKDTSMMFVSRDEASASRVIQEITPRMREAKLNGNWTAAKHSFSGFIFSEEFDNFLR